MSSKPKALFDAILGKYHPFNKVWIGLSGGLDSVVLLHIAIHSSLLKAQAVKPRAIHVHHGLSPNADAWAGHCQKLCVKAGIPYIQSAITTEPCPGESIEAWAREVRRRCFLNVMQPGDLLLTAQHQDDQAETVLLQLLRGAGVKGLSAMHEASVFGPGKMLRPLLGMTRADIQAYAEQYELSWVEDESNRNMKFDRNFLRHEIMPRISARWPASNVVLARAAENAADISEVLQRYLDSLLPTVISTKGQLAIPALTALASAEQRLLLQAWLQQQGAGHVSRAQLQQILDEVIAAKPEAEPCYYLKPFSVRRYADRLYVVPEQSVISENYCQSWDGAQPLLIPGWGRLDKTTLAAQGLAVEALDWANVSVRFRQGGERCRPKGRRHSQYLKKLFQEYHVEPWLRDRLPLLYCDNKLVMVVGGWVCE